MAIEQRDLNIQNAPTGVDSLRIRLAEKSPLLEVESVRGPLNINSPQHWQSKIDWMLSDGAKNEEQYQGLQFMLQSVGLGSIVTAATTDSTLSRRKFLRLMGITAGSIGTAILISACDTVSTPQVSKFPVDRYTGVLKNKEYDGLNNNQKAKALLSGRLPERWNNLSTDAFIEVLQNEIKGVLIPVASKILGGQASDAQANLRFVNGLDEMFTVARERMVTSNDPTVRKEQEKDAADLVQYTVGLTIEGDVDLDKRQYMGNKFVIVDSGRLKQIALNQISRFKTVRPDLTFYHEQGYVNSVIAAILGTATIHELVHFFSFFRAIIPKESVNAFKSRIYSIYPEGIETIENGRRVKVVIDDIFSQEGTQIRMVTSSKEKISINHDLVEIFRAYKQELLMRELDRLTNTPTDRYRLFPFTPDVVAIRTFDNLSNHWGISPTINDLSGFYFDLIDFFKQIAKSNKKDPRFLKDQDVASIFRVINLGYSFMLGFAKPQEIYKDGDENPYVESVWEGIQKVINSTQKLEANYRSYGRELVPNHPNSTLIPVFSGA